MTHDEKLRRIHSLAGIIGPTARPLPPDSPPGASPSMFTRLRMENVGGVDYFYAVADVSPELTPDGGPDWPGRRFESGPLSVDETLGILERWTANGAA